MQRMIIVITAIALAGCTTTPMPTAILASRGAEAPGDDQSLDTKGEILKNWDAAMLRCDEHMASERERYLGSGKRELTIASIGIIAGSIVVPALAAKTAAAKSAVAAWGGMSGAANAAQYTLQQKGVSASRLAASHEATRTEIKDATAKFSEATKNVDRLKALNLLIVACRFPALPGADAPGASATGAGSE